MWWSLHLRREAASVPLARRVLLDTMSTAGVDPDQSHDIALALTEACANAVEHVRSAEAGDTFQVTAAIREGRLHVQVMDSGSPIPVRTVAPPVLRAPLVTSPAPAGDASPTASATGSVPGVACRRARRRRRPLTVARALRRAPAGAASEAHDPAAATAGTGAEPAGHADEYGLDALTAATADLPGVQLPGTALPDPEAEHGRGLFLIRSLVDHVHLHAHPRQGTVVSFEKTLRYRAHDTGRTAAAARRPERAGGGRPDPRLLRAS